MNTQVLKSYFSPKRAFKSLNADNYRQLLEEGKKKKECVTIFVKRSNSPEPARSRTEFLLALELAEAALDTLWTCQNIRSTSGSEARTSWAPSSAGAFSLLPPAETNSGGSSQRAGRAPGSPPPNPRRVCLHQPAARPYYASSLRHASSRSDQPIWITRKPKRGFTFVRCPLSSDTLTFLFQPGTDYLSHPSVLSRFLPPLRRTCS